MTVQSQNIKYEKDYLWSFLFAPIIAAAMAFYLVMNASVHEMASNNAVTLNLGLIDQFQKTAEHTDISFIMLGNSRVRYAAAYGFDPDKIVTLPDGRTAAALQFAKNAAQFLVYNDLADHILLARPDYIVLMDTLLSNDRPPKESPLVKYARMVVDSTTDLIKGKKPAQIWYEDRNEHEMSCYQSFGLKLMNKRIKTTAERDRHSLDPEVNPNIEPAREFIDRAVKAGIKIVVLHLPPNMDILDQYNVPDYFLNSYGINHRPTPQELLPANYKNVTWLDYPAPHDRNFYCDFVHLNDKGRALSSPWLLGELAELSRK